MIGDVKAHLMDSHFCSLPLICFCPHDGRESLHEIQLLAPSQWPAQSALKVSIDVTEILSLTFLRSVFYGSDPIWTPVITMLCCRNTLCVPKVRKSPPLFFLQYDSFFHLSQFERC